MTTHESHIISNADVSDTEMELPCITLLAAVLIVLQRMKRLLKD